MIIVVISTLSLTAQDGFENSTSVQIKESMSNEIFRADERYTGLSDIERCEGESEELGRILKSTEASPENNKNSLRETFVLKIQL